jgi:hypothetical protein
MVFSLIFCSQFITIADCTYSRAAVYLVAQRFFFVGICILLASNRILSGSENVFGNVILLLTYSYY